MAWSRMRGVGVCVLRGVSRGGGVAMAGGGHGTGERMGQHRASWGTVAEELRCGERGKGAGGWATVVAPLGFWKARGSHGLLRVTSPRMGVGSAFGFVVCFGSDAVAPTTRGAWSSPSAARPPRRLQLPPAPALSLLPLELSPHGSRLDLASPKSDELGHRHG